MPQTDWPALHGSAFAGARVLVTGGAGFIGSHLAEALAALGAKVVVVDDLSTGSPRNLAGIGVELIQASILDDAAMTAACRGCRWVFHLAALGSVPQSIQQPRQYVHVNVTGTLHVFEAARAAGVARVIYAASSSAYGQSLALPKIETMPPQPCSPYAATKLAGEALMSAFSGSVALETLCLRYFNIFGPRQTADSAYAAVIAAFAKALLEGRAPVVFGDGTQSRDFTYVDNAVQANLLAARRVGPCTGQPINIGCGRAVSVTELAAAMAADLGRPDLKPRLEPERIGDVKHSLADLAHARDLLGYRPLMDLKAGLKPTLAWYRQQLRPAS